MSVVSAGSSGSACRTAASPVAVVGAWAEGLLQIQCVWPGLDARVPR